MAERMVEVVGYKDPIGGGLYNIGVTDERIVRCRDCKHEFEEWGYPYCCRNAPHSVVEVDGDGFCKWGEPRNGVISIDKSAKKRIDQLETCVKNQRKEITKLLAEIERFKERLAEGKSIIRCQDCAYGYQHDGKTYPKGDRYKGEWYCIVWGDGMQGEWTKPDGYCHKARLRGEE